MHCNIQVDRGTLPVHLTVEMQWIYIKPYRTYTQRKKN